MTVYPVSKRAAAASERATQSAGPVSTMAGPGQPPKHPNKAKNAYGSPTSASCVGAGQGQGAAVPSTTTSSVPLPTSVDLLLARGTGAEAGGTRRRSSAASGNSRVSGRSRRSPRERSAPVTSPSPATSVGVGAAHGGDPGPAREDDSGLGSSQGGQGSQSQGRQSTKADQPVVQDGQTGGGGGREPQAKARGLFGEDTSLACTYRATVRRASAASASRVRSRSTTSSKSPAVVGRSGSGRGESGSVPDSRGAQVPGTETGAASSPARAGAVSATLDDDEERAEHRPKGLHGEDTSLSCSARPAAPTERERTADSPMAPADGDDVVTERVGDDAPVTSGGDIPSAPRAAGAAEEYNASPALVQKMSKGLLAAEGSTASCISGHSSPGGGLAVPEPTAKIKGIFGDDTSASCHQPAAAAPATASIVKSGAYLVESPGTAPDRLSNSADRDRAQTFLNTPPSAEVRQRISQARMDLQAAASFPSGEVMVSKHTIGDTPAVGPEPPELDVVRLSASRGRGDSGQQLEEPKTLDLSDVRRSVCLDQDMMDDVDADDEAVAVFTSVDQEPSEVNILLGDELALEERIEVGEDSDFQTGDEGGATEEEDNVGELAAVGDGETRKERAWESDYATADEDEDGEGDDDVPTKTEGPPLPYLSECVKEAVVTKGVPTVDFPLRPDPEQEGVSHRDRIGDETRRTDDLAPKDEEMTDVPQGMVEDAQVADQDQKPEADGDAALNVDVGDDPTELKVFKSECFAQGGDRRAGPQAAGQDEERLEDAEVHEVVTSPPQTVLDQPEPDAQTEIPEQVNVEDTDSGRGDSITDLEDIDGSHPAEEAHLLPDERLEASPEDMQPALSDSPKAEAGTEQEQNEPALEGSGDPAATAEAQEPASAPLTAYTSECLRPVRSEPRDTAHGPHDPEEEQLEQIGEPLASLTEDDKTRVEVAKSEGTLREGDDHEGEEVQMSQSICLPPEQKMQGERGEDAASPAAAGETRARAPESVVGLCVPEVCEVAPIPNEVTPTASIRVSPPPDLVADLLEVGKISTADIALKSALSSGHTSLLAPPSGQEIPSPPPEPAGPAGRDGGDGDFGVEQSADEIEEALDVTGSRSAVFRSECLGSRPLVGKEGRPATGPSDAVPSATSPSDAVPSATSPSDAVPSATGPPDTVPSATGPSDAVPTATGLADADPKAAGTEVELQEDATVGAERVAPPETGRSSHSRDSPAGVTGSAQLPRGLKSECIRDASGAVPTTAPKDVHAQHYPSEDEYEHPVVRRDTPFPPLGVVSDLLVERIRSLTIDEPLLEEPEEEASLEDGDISFLLNDKEAAPVAGPTAAGPSPAAISAVGPAVSGPSDAVPSIAAPPSTVAPDATPSIAGPSAAARSVANPSPAVPTATTGGEAGEASDDSPPLRGPTFCTCEDDGAPRRQQQVQQPARVSLPGREPPGAGGSGGPRPGPGDRMRRCSNCGEEWMSVLSGLEAASRRRAMVARTMAACERELGPLHDALRRLHEKVRALDLPELSPQGAGRSASQAFYPEVLRTVQSRSATGLSGGRASGAAPTPGAASTTATPCPYCGLQLVPEAALSPLARMYILLSQRKGPPLPPEPPEPPDDQPEQDQF